MEETTESHICDRDSACVNFRRSGKTFCSACGVSITMNHFHDSLRGLRLCETCCKAMLANTPGGVSSFIPLGPEPRSCANYQECFGEVPFGLYLPKECSECHAAPLMIHYHDITSNTRLCLECLTKRYNETEL